MRKQRLGFENGGDDDDRASGLELLSESREKGLNRRIKFKKDGQLGILEDARGDLGEFLKNIHDDSRVMVANLDVKFNFTFVNAAYAEFSGHDQNFFIGKNYFDLYPNEKKKGIFLDVLKTGKPHYARAKPAWFTKSKGGEITYWDWSLMPVKDANKVRRLILSLVNVTEEKQAQDELKVKVEQREAVAKLSQLALETHDLDKLMNEACFVAAKTLEVQYAKTLELLPGNKELVLRAGWGWRGGHIGEVTVDAGVKSQAGFTILRNEPVLVEDVRSEKRFAVPSLLHDHRVLSSMTVVIPGRDASFGVIGVDSVTKRKFTRDDVNFLQMVANILSAAIQNHDVGYFLKKILKGVEQAADPIFITDRAGIIEYVNPAFEAVSGYSRKEVMGETPGILRSGVHNKEFYKKMWKTILEGRTFRGIMVNKKKNGDIYYDEQIITPIKDEHGKITHFVATGRDITQKFRAEEELRRAYRELEARVRERTVELTESLKALKENEERYRLLFENSSDAILLLSDEGKILSANAAACRIFGRSENELKKIGRDGIIDIRDARVLRAVKEHESMGKFRGELVFLKKNGAAFTGEISSNILEDSHGSIKSVAIIRDITDRKKIEQMKSDFVSFVSHQLRNPMTGILLNLENILYGAASNLTRDQLEGLNDSRSLIFRMRDLINDLLNVSRLERGVVKVDIKEARLSEIVRQAVDAYREDVNRKRLALRLEGFDEDMVVMADKPKLLESIKNVLDNAVKFTDTGRITVRIKETESEGVIEVMDTGRGIGKEIMGKIFLKEKEMGEGLGGGSGLGLYIAKNFMNLQGGDVSVKSILGRGSVFALTIPKKPTSILSSGSYD